MNIDVAVVSALEGTVIVCCLRTRGRLLNEQLLKQLATVVEMCINFADEYRGRCCFDARGHGDCSLFAHQRATTK